MLIDAKFSRYRILFGLGINGPTITHFHRLGKRKHDLFLGKQISFRCFCLNGIVVTVKRQTADDVG